MSPPKVSIEQVKAARALLRWSQNDFAETTAAIRAAIEAAGVEFIAENGGGPGVRVHQKRLARSPA